MKEKVKIDYFGLSLRNLGRHKVKTIITLIAVAVGVLAYVWMDAWLLGMNIDSKRNLINYETGSSKIYAKAYFNKKDELPMYESFTNYQDIIKKLNDNGFNASPNFVFGGSLLSPKQEVPFLFIGLDPELEKKTLSYYKFVKEGTFVEKGQFKILIGERGAENLGVKVGDSVRLSTVIDKKDENGKIKHINQLIELIVGGIVNSPNPKTNGNIGYLPLDILQDEMGLLLEGHIIQICIRKADVSESALPNNTESVLKVKQILGDTLRPELTIVDWATDAKDYIAASNGDNVSNRVMLIFLFIIVFMGIANTMLMAVIERTKEIGMLRSMGLLDHSVIILFLFEAGLIGFIGSLIGNIASIPLNYFMVTYGIDYSEMAKQMNGNFGYRITAIFRSAWNFHTMIASVIICTIVSAAMAFLPALKAVKMSVVETLRFE
ncbi:MAG: hypothetical protein A2086_07425 [Spirochaetes bacterium GWD1_27_9]|nr:MAG: hypothetical protein A2Z98_09515 [Spirochaetes bacterium GWB1_27_13]OHD26276.1 MAG: hypothetical protein A2Y34_13175 [Spirochaetes bacterium GWC1_27_15]OHD32124.1 MAG: hypothetical protein A2086_07425 [Spirochaetes bacterium GWD1_27_9]